MSNVAGRPEDSEGMTNSFLESGDEDPIFKDSGGYVSNEEVSI